MNAIAIITARGGSKRIPGKNKRSFLGKPIICYSIEAARKSGLFEEVMVSTDDQEIAQIAQEAGASVPFLRSETTADDFATTDDVLLEVLEEYEKRGRTFTYMACLYPTAPFITAEKLQEAFRILTENKASGVMPVVQFSFPPQRGMWVRDGRLTYCSPEDAPKRSQDLEPVYHDCGQFYFYQTKPYRESRGQLPEGYYPILVSEEEVQDIDQLSDWKLAEMKYKLLYHSDR
ncbi:MAG: pseudaminic acid cytidylyltransferase [Lachnospiraceae bacterium]|nr:pseudaminic acid cytidylyltransferase [Lachnospiraceae bacterium]